MNRYIGELKLWVSNMRSKDSMRRFIHDPYFEKGHWIFKIRQTILTILAWIVLLVPVYWTFSATVFITKSFKGTIWSVNQGRDMFYSFARFLGGAFIVLFIITLSFTFYNNYYTKHHVKKHAIYDENRLLERREAIKDFYTQEFGERSIRRNQIRYYSVNPQQNFDVGAIHKIYEKFEAKK